MSHLTSGRGRLGRGCEGRAGKRQDCHRVAECTDPKSVRRFVGLGQPGLENGVGFVAEELVHGDAALVGWNGELAIDEGIVEAGGRGVSGRGGEGDLGRASPVNGTKAHWAGFAGGEQFTVIELKGFETFAGFADGDDFGMGGGVVGGRDAVDTCGNEGAILCNDGRERAAAIADVFEARAMAWRMKFRDMSVF